MTAKIPNAAFNNAEFQNGIDPRVSIGSVSAISATNPVGLESYLHVNDDGIDKGYVDATDSAVAQRSFYYAGKTYQKNQAIQYNDPFYKALRQFYLTTSPEASVEDLADPYDLSIVRSSGDATWDHYNVTLQSGYSVGEINVDRNNHWVTPNEQILEGVRKNRFFGGMQCNDGTQITVEPGFSWQGWKLTDEGVLLKPDGKKLLDLRGTNTPNQKVQIRKMTLQDLEAGRRFAKNGGDAFFIWDLLDRYHAGEIELQDLNLESYATIIIDDCFLPDVTQKKQTTMLVRLVNPAYIMG